MKMKLARVLRLYDVVNDKTQEFEVEMSVTFPDSIEPKKFEKGFMEIFTRGSLQMIDEGCQFLTKEGCNANPPGS